MKRMFVIARWWMPPLFAFLTSLFTIRDTAAQTPIFIDDFENGMNDTSLADGGRWLTVTGGGGTVAEGTLPNYQTENNPFSSGSLYVRMYDPSTAVGPRFVTSDAMGTDGRGPSITGNVTTFSFDFWEPDVLTMYSAGISFGYSATNDVNAAGRTWRAFLVDGLLNPSEVDEGAAVNYPKEMVHTIWMMANDTTSPVSDYRDGQTLDPSEADVWISLAGADPMFAFSLNRQNPTLGPHGIGFRAFSGDMGEVLIDNVLLVPGATFDRGAFSNIPLIPGDTNGNMIGGEFPEDFEPIRANFRMMVDSREEGDLVRNGVVDFDDFHQWKAAFLGAGGSLAGVDLGFLSSVPEPSAALLMLIGSAALVCWRARSQEQGAQSQI